METEEQKRLRLAAEAEAKRRADSGLPAESDAARKAREYREKVEGQEKEKLNNTPLGQLPPGAKIEPGSLAAAAVEHPPQEAPAPAPTVDTTTADTKAALDAARARHTDPGAVAPATAGPVTVDRTGTTQATPTGPGFAGRTTAPAAVTVNPITGERIAAPTVDTHGVDLQNEAARQFQAIASGAAPSVAENQLANAQGRAAAEQLSIAAGARGNGVVAARRNAAANIGGQQTEAAGQYAALRAKEISDATTGLAGVGGQIQTQSLAKAGLETDVAKANAGNTIDVAKSNQLTEKDTKLAHARDQLTADVASDERLQGVMTEAARLKQLAAAGNQDAAVKLSGMDAQIKSELGRFNAQQIQTASGQNIENRLKAMGLDDTFVSQMTDAYLKAEGLRDYKQIEMLKAQMQQAAIDATNNGNALDFFANIFGGAAKIISDERAKKNIKDVAPADVDAFLRAVGKTQTWEYKDPANGEGEKTGPMAQDMRADKLAAEAVGERPDGKMNLDYQRLTALALAGVGRLNQRLEAVEGKRPADVGGYLRSRKEKN